MKKFLSFFLTAIMLLSLLPMSIFASALNTAKLTVDSVDATPGDTVSVDVKLENNPGIVSASITVSFDDGLTLIGATNGRTFPASMSFTPPNQLKTVGEVKGSCNFMWSGTDIDDDDIRDGVILTLKFKVSEDADIGDNYNISITNISGNIVDRDLQCVEVTPAYGKISIIDYTPGDANDDGTITVMDVVMISRYIVDGCKYDSKGYAIRINEKAADVNGDGSITVMDVVMISRYIVDGCKTDPNGYNIKFVSAGKTCEHNLEHINAIAATCVEDGNIEYWHCTKCNKYFSDADGLRIVSTDNIVIAATGHNVVEDPAVPATYESTGLTAGSHCSVCGTVIVEQIVIPMLEAETYSITYDIANGDTYLASLDIENPNLNYYISEKGLSLKNPSVPGYTFLGWYDLPAGNNAEIVKKIAAGSKEDYMLYAHWEKINYKVQYDSDLVPVENDTYSVDAPKVLATPKLDGYIFVGWSDDDGNILRQIPKGETGHKLYTANWISERNQAWTNKNIGEPTIIYEDEENGQIIFVYEIGEIRNVPVQVIHDFGKINDSGVSKTETKTFTKKVSYSEMSNYTSTVSNATTDSFGWTLSSGWSNQINVNSEWCEENGLTEEQAKSVCTNDTNGWYVSSGKSGSDTTTTYGSTETRDLKTTTNNKKTYNNDTTEKRQDFSAELDLSAKETVSVGITETASAGLELTQELDLKYSNGRTTTEKRGNDTDEGNGTDTGTITKTGSDSVHVGSWNSESGTSGSHSVTNTEAITNTISKKVSEKTGYGESYLKNGNESSSGSVSNQSSSTDSYGGSVTFSTEESETITQTFTTENTKSGFHRWVRASNAHVFACVGYDIATSSYYVTNFSIMDDRTFDYEDYSYSTSDYNDHQTGVISFEIPTDVEEYVKDKVCGSQGLEVSRDGLVTNYTGTDDFVIIPEYAVVNGPTGSTYVKVTGIKEGAFSAKKNEIVAIELSDFITEIPNNAFYGCTELQHITAKNLTKIGDNAFYGCSKLTRASISDNITSIGENAFFGVSDLAVNASNLAIVNKVINSGAENILLKISDKCTNLENVKLNVLNNVNSFMFDGSGKTYRNVIICSDAAETTICNAIFSTYSGNQFTISSPKVSFQEISVASEGISVKLLAENTKLSLFGESTIISNSDNAVLCKSVEMSKVESNLFSQLHVDGNVLTCGDIENQNYIDVFDGSIIKISEEDFEKYVKGTFIVTFDANGGSLNETSKTVYYGQTYGELPVPTRVNYAFAGWYTATSGGEQITNASIVLIAKNQTLYAHWEANKFNLIYDANGGNVSPSSKILTFGDTYGELPTPARWGFTFAGWYTAASGGTQVSASTTPTSATNVTIYAHWIVNSFKVSWSSGTGYSISVNRTSSPYAGEYIGALSNGSTVFYGDVLSVTYTASTGYSISTKGATSITVGGDVNSSTIYATASPNSYTYTILYRSSNGTDLGSSSATYKFGTTNTISAPAKSGYTTPGSQSVKWDATSKTITFTYSPTIPAGTQSICSGRWWTSSSGYTKLDYQVSAEWRNRTANSIEIRIHWTNTLTATSGYYGYTQQFEWWGWHTIANNSTFGSAGGTRSASCSSDWHTYSVSATQTSLTTGSTWKDNNGKSGDWQGTLTIPAY